MFGWVGRWFAPDAVVFRFWDGQRWRVADPLVVRRRLNEHGGDRWPELVGALRQLDPHVTAALPPDMADRRTESADTAVRDLAALVSKAFGVRPAEDGGLSEADRVRVLADFLRWAAKVAEDTLPFVNSPPATASAGGG